ncbi:MAG: hypothetical protein HY904_23555 [Deltaproteobacteria bacterium]|nr:hypothetical protein [Deltaproteobacteria bacterium]
MVNGLGWVCRRAFGGLVLAGVLGAAAPAAAEPPPAKPAATAAAADKGAPAQPDPAPALAVLRSHWGWAVAGAAGTILPLLLLVLPLFWIPTLGPWGLPFVLVTIGWGALMVALGGAVTWGLLAAFSDTRSGFVLPLVVAAATGAGGVVITFLVSAGLMLPLLAVAGYYNWTTEPTRHWYRMYLLPTSWYLNPFSAMASVGLSVIWGLGLVTTALVGPVLTGFVYHRLGEPRDTDAIHIDTMTGQQLLVLNEQDGKPRPSAPPRARPADDAHDDDAGTGAAATDATARKGGGKGKGKGAKPAVGKATAGSRSSVVGGSCVSDEDCIGLCSTQKDFGGGMCTLACNTTADCPAAATCVDVAGGMCAVTCQEDKDCAAFSARHVCGTFYEKNGGAARACQVP